MYRNIAIAQYRITESQNHHDEQTRALHCAAGREGEKSCTVRVIPIHRCHSNVDCSCCPQAAVYITKYFLPYMYLPLPLSTNFTLLASDLLLYLILHTSTSRSLVQ